MEYGKRHLSISCMNERRAYAMHLQLQSYSSTICVHLLLYRDEHAPLHSHCSGGHISIIVLEGCDCEPSLHAASYSPPPSHSKLDTKLTLSK